MAKWCQPLPLARLPALSRTLLQVFRNGELLFHRHLQIVLELLGCLLLADFAARIAPVRLASAARMATLWLAALCPFTASYAVVPLAETPTLFALALALWAMARFHQKTAVEQCALVHLRRNLRRAPSSDGALQPSPLRPRWSLGSIAAIRSRFGLKNLSAWL